MRTVQSVASIARQVLAVAVSVYGVLTQNIAALHIPAAAATVLIAFGPTLLAIEHYVSDPSTGNAVKVTETPQAVAATAKVIANAKAELAKLETAVKPSPGVSGVSTPTTATSPQNAVPVPQNPPPPWPSA
jgi:hypothetical protein